MTGALVLPQRVRREGPIRYFFDESTLLAENPLRILVLTTVGNLSVWEQLCVLVARWERIEELSGRDPPWMHAVTRNGLREMPYPA